MFIGKEAIDNSVRKSANDVPKDSHSSGAGFNDLSSVGLCPMDGSRANNESWSREGVGRTSNKKDAQKEVNETSHRSSFVFSRYLQFVGAVGGGVEAVTHENSEVLIVLSSFIASDVRNNYSYPVGSVGA